MAITIDNTGDGGSTVSYVWWVDPYNVQGGTRLVDNNNTIISTSSSLESVSTITVGGTTYTKGALLSSGTTASNNIDWAWFRYDVTASSESQVTIQTTGATSPTLTLTNVPIALNNYFFRLRAVNAFGSVISNSVQALVTAGPTAPPPPPPPPPSGSYIWWIDPYNVQGGTRIVDNNNTVISTSSTLNTDSSITINGTTYTKGALLSSGTTTSNNIAWAWFRYDVSVLVGPATLPPTITTQPQNVFGVEGAAAGATFSVAASGATSYQWERSVDNGANWSTSFKSGTTGTTSAQITIPSLDYILDDGDLYRVLVSNQHGTVTSDAAALYVEATSTGQWSIRLDSDLHVIKWPVAGSTIDTWTEANTPYPTTRTVGGFVYTRGSLIQSTSQVINGEVVVTQIYAATRQEVAAPPAPAPAPSPVPAPPPPPPPGDQEDPPEESPNPGWNQQV